MVDNGSRIASRVAHMSTEDRVREKLASAERLKVLKDILGFLETIDPRDADIFHLHFITGKTVEEISELFLEVDPSDSEFPKATVDEVRGSLDRTLVRVGSLLYPED